LKGVVTNNTIENKFHSVEDVIEVRVEHQPFQFLYLDGNLYYFMNQETYEQIPVEEERINKAHFISDGQECTLAIDVDNEQVLYAKPPDQITATVEDTRPGFKGDTAQGGSKPATLDSGATIKVPLLINEGEEIKVDTRTEEYIERVTSNYIYYGLRSNRKPSQPNC